MLELTDQTIELTPPPSTYELLLAVDFCAREYGRVFLNEETALMCYEDAIDRGASKAEKDQLYEVYDRLQSQRYQAYDAWQNAKARLLGNTN